VGGDGADVKSASREVAFQVVRDVFGQERRLAQAALDVRSRRAGLDPRDRAFATELAYGTIKHLRLLDWMLEPYVGARRKSLDPAIAEILRLGVYQLRCMAAVEDHAAVSETVDLVWRHGHRGTVGLVNAVLRKVASEHPVAPRPEDFATTDDYYGVAYSVPTWVARQFGEVLGDEREAALAGVDRAPRAAVTVNRLRGDVAAARAALSERGVETEISPLVPDTLLVAAGPVSTDPDGRWFVQGEAAAIPVDLLDAAPGESVLELCSGRGHKSVALAARMGDAGSLVCVEQDERKIPVLESALKLAGISIAAIVAGDAREAVPDLRAERVLLDAPCTGLGTIGRHPEARWRKTPEDGARLAVAQAALLRAAADRTAPGGRLVYSVCSIDPREGRDVVTAFLAERAEFARVVPPERYASLVRDGDVLVPPGIEGRDGFYVATLVRAR